MMDGRSLTEHMEHDERWNQVLQLTTDLADRVLDAQIAGRTVPTEQATALMRVAHLLHTNGLEWPPMLSMAVRGLAAVTQGPSICVELEHHQPQAIEALPSYGGNLALGKPATQSSLSQWSNCGPAQDPGGGANGVISGLYGFHTDFEVRPWWQVDLGAIYPMREVRVYNRMDSGQERSRTLQVLVSTEGATWTEVHDQAGKTFGGADGQPLRVMLNNVTGRYVRLQLAEFTSLHLDEVQVF